MGPAHELATQPAVIAHRLRKWIERRRAIRKLWREDARALIARDERNAYYHAHRLAARARAQGDTASFLHWAKVAAEVARASPNAEMEMAVVDAIVAEELERPTDLRS